MMSDKKTVNVTKIKRGISFAIGLSVVAIVILVSYSAAPETWVSLCQIKINFLLMALLCLVSMWLLEGVGFGLLIHGVGKFIPFLSLVRIFLASNFVGFVTPFGSGGVPAQIYLLTKKGLSAGESTAVVSTRALLSSWFFGIIGPVAFFLLRPHLSLKSSWIDFFGPTLVALFLFTLLFLYLLWRPQKGGYLASACCNWSPLVRCFGTERMKRIQTSIAHEIEKLHQGLSLLFRSNFLMVLAVAGCIILCWLLLFAIAPLLLLGFGVKINVVQVLFYQFVLFFLIPLSPTPGGSGAAELGFAALLTSLVPKHLLAVFVILWRFLTYYLNLLVGGIILVLFLRK